MSLERCRCEHYSHFADEDKENWVTPNGNKSHEYGQQFHHKNVVMIDTPFGIFAMCEGCRDDCYSAYEARQAQ